MLEIKVFTGVQHIRMYLKECEKLESLLINHSYLKIPVDSETTFDDVLHECAKRCKIPPVYLQLFSIYNPKTDLYMKLCSRVQTSDVNLNTTEEDAESRLEFRIRFLVKSEIEENGIRKTSRRCALPEEDAKPFLSDTVINYLYRQQREYFLNDKIELNPKETDVIGAALGVAVLDMLCLAKEMNTDMMTISQQIKFKYLLPKSCSRELSKPNMTFCNRLRTKKKFNHYLEYFSPTAQRWRASGYGTAYYQKRYLLNLEMLCESYGVEKYELAVSDFIKVSADLGIEMYRDANPEYCEKWCDFSEMTDMNLQVQHGSESNSNKYIVNLSKMDGRVVQIVLKSLASAENLASCIDGYYRLLVDAHHYLCKEVCSDRLVKHLKLGCHGPISCSFAEHRLRKNCRLGNCLIRQSQESYDEYFINTVCEIDPPVIRNFKLDRNDKGHLGLYGCKDSHIHETLEELLEACKDGTYNGKPVPFLVDQIVTHERKGKSNLIVKLCSDSDNDKEQGMSTLPIAPLTKIIRLKDYGIKQNLGTGRFTEVKVYQYRRRDNEQFIMKNVFDLNQKHDLGQKHHIDESFEESMTMLNCLNHEHIVKLVGMTQKNMFVLEYVPHQSITSYLSITQRDERTPKPTEWSTWFLQVLWQITHACNYLEELGYAHGNIRGKNVLLFNSVPKPFIKLSDAGVRTCCSNRYKSQVIIEPVLTAPWLAYEFCQITQDPQSALPTIAGDKWSFATTVCEICSWGEYPEKPMNAYELSVEMKKSYTLGAVMPIPKFITGSSELPSLILLCWSNETEKRPTFQQILRELGNTLSSDYILPLVVPQLSNTHQESFVCDSIIEQDLPIFEDEKLRYLMQLGEGHFGTVDLFIYDKYRTGSSQRVAVKSLKRSSNKVHVIIAFKKEIETMRKLNHKYVVKLLGITEPSGRIVMEYLNRGSLGEYLREKREKKIRLPSLYSTLLRFASQIAQGMLALQELRLIHRDLALRNILLAMDKDTYYVKISDFGLSRFLTDDMDTYFGYLEEFPAQWYAPECLCRKKEFRFESDVWSFGVTMWEMFSYGDKPIYSSLPAIVAWNLVRLEEHLKKGHRLPKTEECPQQVYDLMMECWKYKPEERINFTQARTELDQLLQHGL